MKQLYSKLDLISEVIHRLKTNGIEKCIINEPVITFQPVHSIIHEQEAQHPKIISVTLTFVRPHVSLILST